MSPRHSPIAGLAAALMLSLGAADPSHAADPPGSTPSAPRAPAADPTPPLPPVGPSPRPTLHGISVPLPPPSLTDPSAPNDAEIDQAIGVLVVRPGDTGTTLGGESAWATGRRHWAPEILDAAEQLVAAGGGPVLSCPEGCTCEHDDDGGSHVTCGDPGSGPACGIDASASMVLTSWCFVNGEVHTWSLPASINAFAGGN